MKVVQINATCGSGSTGKICVAISRLLSEKGIENYILYSSGRSDYALGIKCASKLYTKYQALKSHVFGNYGFNSHIATKKIISELERIQPDIVHLHNIHGHDCNLAMLFRYFRTRPNMRLLWTFHDCWAFTAYCPNFDMVDCSKWKTGCKKCPQKKFYSFFFDRSEEVHRRKIEAFSGVNLTIITPSQWLAGLVKRSFLKDYPVKVINNGIDLSVFKPTPSNFRQKYNCCGKIIVLGVAFAWGERKGLDVFIQMAAELDDRFQIVLVGTSNKTDRLLPENIISIHRTADQVELAEIYTAADVFVNPTREESFGLVNAEAIACGTPVITFQTGGSPEIIDASCGKVVNKNDTHAMLEAIVDFAEGRLTGAACINRAQKFSNTDRYEEYISIYLESYNKQ